MRWLIGVTLAVLVATAMVTNVVASTDGDRPGSPSARSVPGSAASNGSDGVPVSLAPDGGATTTSAGSAPDVDTSGGPAGSLRAYSPAEIARHDDSADCWLVVAGRVYDVTAYLRQHPGGSRTILPWCGRESTEAFATEDGRGEHSPEAYHLLSGYLIGAAAG